MPKLSPDKPGIVKRVDSLETQVGRLEDVRDNMMENVGETQYIHAPRHANGGDDPLSPSDIGAANKVHSHSYTDITNLQEMINAFPGFDLNGLVSALVPLIKPYIGGTARKVGEYGNRRSSYLYNQNLIRLEGLTPGKLLFVRGLANQGDAGRAASDVAAYASIYPSISGIWGGMGNKYPGIHNGNYFDQPTFDSVNNSAAICRDSFDAKLANPDGVLYFQGYGTFLMAIRSGVKGLDSDDRETFGQNFFLIHSPTVRLCCTSLSGDDYPVLEFWEY